VLIIALLSSCEKSPHQLRMVVPTEPEDRSIVEELGDLLDDEALVRFRLTDTPLSEESALDAIVAGEADIALVSNNLPFRSEIATVMPLYPTVLHIGRRRAGRLTLLRCCDPQVPSVPPCAIDGGFCRTRTAGQQ